MVNTPGLSDWVDKVHARTQCAALDGPKQLWYVDFIGSFGDLPRERRLKYFKNWEFQVYEPESG